MEQRDAILLLPLCNFDVITACDAQASEVRIMEPGTFNVYQTVQKDGVVRDQHLCEKAVPGACPRVQCFHEGEAGKEGKYLSCRMQLLIQGHRADNQFWMKLPCSICPETRKLHPTTEAFYHSEDRRGN